MFQITMRMGRWGRRNADIKERLRWMRNSDLRKNISKLSNVNEGSRRRKSDVKKKTRSIDRRDDGRRVEI